MHRKWWAGMAILSVAALAALAGPSGYHLLTKTSLSGAGGWDYVAVDAAARRVYVAHATQVEVLDADSYKLLASIPNVAGAHGIAIAPELGRGFLTAGKADTAIIFDLKTLKVLGQAKTGQKPDAIAYDPATQRVFAMNGDGESATVINAADGSVSGTIKLGGGPEFAVVDGKGNLYVNLEDQSVLLHIDTQTMMVKDRWSVAPCQQPSSLAIDIQLRRLFLGCRSHVMAVMDADSGKVVATAPIGDHVDASAFDPSTKMVFHSTGDGMVAVFRQDSPDKYTFLENVATNPGSKTMGLDPKTHNLFIPANEAGTFNILVMGK